nr:DUF1801 domain-containing protein [uncultured Psychroserpens sp.]
MSKNTIHPDFVKHLKHKDQSLIDLYTDLREFILEIHPQSNELLYHTHALTSLYSVSEKMGDGFCMIPIYSNHLNLGFNKGTVLNDPKKLLQGTGKWIRHIAINTIEDYRNKATEDLIKSAIDLALEDTTAKTINQGLIISKIKD